MFESGLVDRCSLLWSRELGDDARQSVKRSLWGELTFAPNYPDLLQNDVHTSTNPFVSHPWSGR
jgi:hypothetical protein